VSFDFAAIFQGMGFSVWSLELISTVLAGFHAFHGIGYGLE
jgi:hypothetical protein